MPAVQILNTVEVVLSAEREGRERKNVFHYGYNGAPPTQAELRQLNEDIRDNITDKYGELVAAGTTFVSVKSTDLNTLTGFQDEIQMSRATIGGGSVFPGNVAHCLTKRTSLRGRSYRGRFFRFDLSEDQFNGDIVNPFYLPLITQLADRLMLPRVGGKFYPAVASRGLHLSRAMTQITWDQVADTQQRRLTGRGR